MDLKKSNIETEKAKELKKLLKKMREEYKETHGRYPEEDGISIKLN